MQTSHERNLVRRAEKFALANEAAHDQTRQRTFERKFLSLDFKDANGDAFDYDDGGRHVQALVRRLDRPFWNQVRDLRFAAALRRVPKDCRPMLEKIRARAPRRKIMRALGMSRATYLRRLDEMLRIFKA